MPAPVTPPQLPSTLDARTKYAGAWQETAARIQARDRVLITFITLTAALVGVSLNKGQELVSVGVGFAALATAFLTRHHDLIIGYLGKFQHDLYKHDVRACGDSGCPEWFSAEYFPEAARQRRMRDIAQYIFIGVGLVAALVVPFPVIHALPLFNFKTILWLLSFLSSLGAIGILIDTGRTRNQISEKISSAK